MADTNDPNLQNQVDLNQFDVEGLGLIADELNQSSADAGITGRNKRFFGNVKPADSNKKKIVKRLKKLVFDQDLGLIKENSAEFMNIRETIFKKISNYEDEYEARKEKIEEHRKIYDQEVQETTIPYPGIPSVTSGSLAGACDVLASKLHKALIEPKPIFKSKPSLNYVKQNKDFFDLLDQHTDFMSYHNEIVDPLDPVMVEVFLSVTKLGNGITKTINNYQEEIITAFDHYESLDELRQDGHDLDEVREKWPAEYRLLSEGQPVDLETEKKIVTITPKTIFVPLNKIRTDAIKSFDDASFILEEFELNYFDMESRFDDEIYYESLRDSYLQEENKHERFTPVEGIIIERNKAKKRYEKYLVTLDLDHGEILRLQKFYYIHNENYYTNFKIMPIENSWEGLGIIGMSKQANKIMEDMLKYAYAKEEMAVAPVQVIASKSIIREETHPFKPKAQWKVNDVNDVKLMNLGNPNTQALFTFISMFKGFEQNRIGINDANFGQTNAQDPAKKTIALLNENFIHIDLYIKNIRIPFSNLSNLISMNYFQFAGDEIEYLAFQENEVFVNKISSDDLRRGVYFTLNAQTSLTNIDSESFFLTEMYQIMLKDDAFAKYKGKRVELIKDWARVNNIKSYPKYLPSDEEIEQDLIRQQAEAQKLLQIEAQQKQLEDQEKIKNYITQRQNIAEYEQGLKDDGAVDATRGDQIIRDEEYGMGVKKGRILLDNFNSGKKDKA